MNRERADGARLGEGLVERFIYSETIYSGKIVGLERWQMTLPNGRPAVREVIRHIGAVGIVAVDAQGAVALVEQYRAPIGRLMLEIPAGKLDDRSEVPLCAAKRELLEEVGLTAERWEKLTAIHAAPAFCDEVVTLFLATELEHGRPQPDEDEFLNRLTVPLEEALAMIGSGQITDAKTICGLYLARERLRAFAGGA